MAGGTARRCAAIVAAGFLSIASARAGSGCPPLAPDELPGAHKQAQPTAASKIESPVNVQIEKAKPEVDTPPTPAPATSSEIAAPQSQGSAPVRILGGLPAGSTWFSREARRTHLEETLQRNQPYTIFVPTDAAQRKLSEATRIALRSSRNTLALATLLSNHVVEGRLTRQDLIGTNSLVTLAGGTIDVDASFGGITVGSADLGQPTAIGDSVLVYPIDTVLIPDGLKLLPDGSLLLGMYVRRPDAMTAAKLSVDRGKTLLVTALIDGANAGPAGVQVGDIVLTIDGRKASVEAGEKAKKNKGIGNFVKLELLRDGEKLSVRVPVGIDPR